MRLKRTTAFVFLILGLLVQTSFAAAAKEKCFTINSPNGKIKLTVLTLNGNLTYKVDFNKTAVIEPSNLGLVIDGKQIGENASIGSVSKYSANERYPYRGVHSIAVNKYKAAKVTVNSTGTPFVLDIRVFDDGLAFRYIVRKEGSSVVEKENTAFIVPAGSTIWSQANNKHYEGSYSKKLSEEFKEGELIGPPATILLPDNLAYMAITEGGLTDFAGMSLTGDGNRGFNANLAGLTKKSGVIESPWRIIVIGSNLNALINTDIIANVSPEFDKKLFPKGYDTDWVKPGRSVWSWLAEERAVTLENMKRFTDMAAKLGFEYNLVDEGWGHWKDGERNQWEMMKELVDYSSKKDVQIWAWKAYPDRKGIEGIKDAAKRWEFFKRCKEVGIVGLKIDFFDSESQEIIDFYQAALRDAAELKLMLNFHGSNKPTGETRTWPNEMTREGIKGMESRPPWAKHNTLLPFTRFIAGHADYTPIHFGNRMGEVSWAHHVASMAVFTSPFLCIGADPQSILDNPCKEMIVSIPSVWDETIVLPQSKVGELVLYARRKGNTWFLAAMNGTHQPQSIKVNLSFLGRGSYTLFELKDDEGKQDNALLETSVLNSQSLLTLSLNPEGGYIGRFERK